MKPSKLAPQPDPFTLIRDILGGADSHRSMPLVAMAKAIVELADRMEAVEKAQEPPPGTAWLIADKPEVGGRT